MNKLKFLLNIYLVCFSIYLMSQNATHERDSLQIMNVMQMQENAWNSGNIDLFMEGYLKSNSVVFSGSNGPVYGWEETKKKYLKSYPNKKSMGNLSFKINSLNSVTNEVSLMIGEYFLKRSDDDSSGYFTLLWKKIDDKWFIVSDHTSAKQ